MANSRSGCFRRGCLGCLGCGALVLVVLVVVGLIGLAELGREPEVQPIDSRQVVPLQPSSPELSAPAGELRPIVSEPGRVVLDVGMTSFRIEPGPAGSPIRVEGRYDAASYELEQSFEQQGELGWTYRLRFRPRGVLARLIFSDSVDDNRVTLYLPRDTPIELRGEIGLGESRLELGGLWLIDTRLELSSGDHEISFGDPLVVPMGMFSVEASFGELDVNDLGNASPSDTRIRHSAGEVDVDLRGAWRADASVEVRCGFGECTVRAPDLARVEIDAPVVMFGESSVRPPRGQRDDPSLPLVKLKVSARAGEVRVD